MARHCSLSAKATSLTTTIPARKGLSSIELPRCATARESHRDRPSRVVTAALLSEVAKVVTLPDLRSEMPEDRVRNRDVEEEVGQNQVPDVVLAAKPPAHDRRCQFVCVGLRAGNLVRLYVLQEIASLKESSLQRRIHHRGVTGCLRIALH